MWCVGLYMMLQFIVKMSLYPLCFIKSDSVVSVEKNGIKHYQETERHSWIFKSRNTFWEMFCHSTLKQILTYR